MKKAKYNFDDIEFVKYERPWGINLELVPTNRVVVRLCTICTNPLPPDRYFNHDECIQGNETDELYLASSHKVHHPTKRTA